MARKKLIRTDSLPYHVTARTNNREIFPLAMPQMWEIVADHCWFLQTVYEVEFQAVVLMPNHFHILLTIPKFDLGLVMNELMKSVSRSSNLITGRSGHLFGGSYHWSLIGNSRYFGHALKYVYRNPVRAKLCQNVEDYRFSSLRGLLGMSHLPFPLHFSRVGMELSLPAAESSSQLNWLNTPFPSEAEALIRKGLRRKQFSEMMNRNTRRPFEILARAI